MQGLFIANGPRIRRGLKFKPFENIHVYEFMCAVLGLQPAKNDGDPAVTRDMLRSRSMTSNSDRITAAGWRIVLLASLGGTLEFYDFVIFGVFARDIAAAIFPATDPLVSLIFSYATFAVGYLARPIGGIVLSHYGDRYGRRAVFLWSVFIMSGATLGMGLVPDYAQIGVAASLLMVTLRLLQGFCLGGELPGALTYVVETAPRIAPFVCGVVFACVTMGVAVATGVSLCGSHLHGSRARARLRMAHRVHPRRPRRRPQFRVAPLARRVAGVRADAQPRLAPAVHANCCGRTSCRCSSGARCSPAPAVSTACSSRTCPAISPAC